MSFSEDFLYYLWKFRLFVQNDLQTVSGEKLEIISTGFYNRDSGPDFGEALIRIGETTWAGSVEMHLHASDWNKHRHSEDKAYNNVILHVVCDYDEAVFRSDGTEIKALDLSGRIPYEIEFRYRELMQNMNWIPCEKTIAGVEDIYIKSWLSRVLTERFEERSAILADTLIKYKGSWEDVFYIMLARNFGFKTNALPFELLAASLPQQILARHRNSPLQVEALIFGQAGFLGGRLRDEYPRRLQREYFYLKKKYGLKPLDKYIWKFLRLRPLNFPTIRLAQFAALVIRSDHLFSKVIEIHDVKAIRAMFSDLPVHAYWRSHFRFDQPAGSVSAQIGAEAVNNLLLNTVTLFLYSYGKQMGKEPCINRALGLLENLPAEINQVIRRFNDIGIKSGNAHTSQALLQLKKCYCDQKKCLNCGIGIKLINN